MNTIYLVTEGCYSDYHVVGVYSTKEKAQLVVDYMNKDVNDSYGGEAGIEEYTLDEATSEIEQGMKQYFVRLKLRTGDLISIEQWTTSIRFKKDKGSLDMDGSFYSHVWASDEQHAVKVANERRAPFLAEHYALND